MRYLSLVVAIACLGLSGQNAAAFHGHHRGGYGYGCGGGYYGGYGGYYGASYGGAGFYGRTAYYSSGPYFSGPINGPMMYSQPYRSMAYYGQSYYSAPIVGQPYASTPVYGQAQRTTTMYPPTAYPPAYSNGQLRTEASPAARPTTTVAVAIQDNAFQPPTISVQPGSTVRWTNNGSHNHTVTAQDNSWDSGDIAPGATYSATFQRPGTYAYYCRHHAGMQGTIVVGSNGSAAPQPGNSLREAHSGHAAPTRGYQRRPNCLAISIRPRGRQPLRLHSAASRLRPDLLKYGLQNRACKGAISRWPTAHGVCQLR